MVKKISLKAIEKEYVVWRPIEIDRIEVDKVERERLRSNQRRMRTKDKLEKAVLQLKKHLQSGDGKFQIKLEANRIASQFNTAKEAKTFVEEKIVRECIEANQALLFHDNDAKTVKPIICAIPGCGTAHVTNELYHLHVMTKHESEAAMDLYNLHLAMNHDVGTGIPRIDELHIMLRHKKGFESVSHFLSYKRGISNISNCADFWGGVQEYKKIEHKAVAYNQQVTSMYDMFIEEGCDRPIDFAGIMSKSSDAEKEEVNM